MGLGCCGLCIQVMPLNEMAPVASGLHGPLPTRQPLCKEIGMPAAHYTDCSIDTTQDNDFCELWGRGSCDLADLKLKELCHL